MKRYGTVTKRHSHTGTRFDPGRSRTDMTKPPSRLGWGQRGGPDEVRTHDLLFRRQTLYPLSYGPVPLYFTRRHDFRASSNIGESPQTPSDIRTYRKIAGIPRRFALDWVHG